MNRYRNTPEGRVLPSPRQPLLWAAMAFAGGILLGTYIWRPTVWWLIAGAFFAISGTYFVQRRTWAARALSLCTLLVAGAFCIQVQPRADAGNAEILPFTDGRAVNITGHIIKEGLNRSGNFGNVRRSLDIETEQIESDGEVSLVRSGVRVSFYSKESQDEDSEPSILVPDEFQYGARLRFTSKLFVPRNFGNPGAFDYRGYLADLGISALGSAKLAEVEILPGLAGSRLELYRTRIHRRIVEKIHQLWPARQAALIDAMVIGEDGFLGQDTRTEFQRSGTYHVLVVSGMNVAILAFVVFWILRRAGISDFVSSVVTVGLAVGYAFVTDVGAPIWRATLMLVLLLGARWIYRSRSMLNAIGAAALGVLITDPKALLGASFQLTFLCVLLVAAIGVPILERTSQPYVRGVRNLSAVSYDWVLPPKVAQFRLDLRAIAARFEVVLGNRVPLLVLRATVWSVLAAFELFLISAVMQLGLALPMAYYFHRATVVGLPANLLVVPLMEVLMPFAVMAVSLGFLSLAAAKVPGLVAGLALEIMTGAVHWLGALRIADRRVATPVLVTILLSAAALALAMVLARRGAALATAGGVLLTLSAFWIAAVPPKPQLVSGVLEVTAIDVGQGDSILVVSPDGRTLLVDAGGTPLWLQPGLDIGETVVSPYLWSRGISRLDTVAITHAHSDHMGGMRAILANFRPRELWLGVDVPTPGLRAILAQARAAGVRIVTYRAGEIARFGEVSVRVLAPWVDPVTQAWRRSDDSLAMKMSFGDTSALLEGDAERQTEKQMATEQPQADLLKVGHHGSATSTMPEFLAAVHPKFAVISVGARNVYGHPRREVLDRLEAAGVAIYRTDVDGAVTFYLDGRSVTPGFRAPN